jgi:predicted nucleic acid-binding protein
VSTLVLDTNILVAALSRGGGSARQAPRGCLNGNYPPVIGPALLAEYEDVLGRPHLFAGCILSGGEREEIVDGFLNRCRWVEVYYAWRPNLPDEADNHLIELAVAARAEAIVTRNLRDLSRGELKFPALKLIIRLTDDKHERLKALAKSNAISVNNLIDELATVALPNHDARVRFEARASRGDPVRAMGLLDRLDRDD